MMFHEPVMTGTKKCARCGEIKDVTQFGPSPRMSSGRHSYCKPCMSKAQGESYRKSLNDPDRIERRRKNGRESAKRRRKEAPEKERGRYLRYKYGLSPERFDEMVAEQEGLCAIPGCSRPATDVDHDHSCCPGSRSCGKCVRRVLCNPCNAALGLVLDDVVRLQGMIDYLRLKDVMVSG